MTRNSQHGTQKPSAWYALGLKIKHYCDIQISNTVEGVDGVPSIHPEYNLVK